MARKPALPEVPNASAMQRLGDLGLDIFAHTPVAMGEALVGLADIPTMGYAGKALEEIGYDPKTLHAMINRQMSEERQHEQVAQSEAYDESFWKGLGYSVTNPAPAIGTIIQSLPMMYGGRAIAQGLMKATPMLPAIAGGIGEGTIAGGMTLEQIRQDAEGGVLTPEQYALGLGAGAVTGGLGYLGGRLAGKLGIEDIDIPNLTPEKAIAEGARKSLVRRIGEGAITEGVFEELPQSMQETIASNLALGKEWDEGLSESAGLGLLTGAAMGGAVQGQQSAKAKIFNAMINKTRVESEKVAAFDEAQQKFQADKQRAETAHKEAVIDGKESADLLGDAPTIDEQRLDESIDKSQAEASEAIQEATAEAEELQEVVRRSTEESVENETAAQIVEMLAPFKSKLNAGDEFEANIIFAARQDLSKKEFRALLQSVYGSAGAVAADQIYPKLQGVLEGIAYEAEEAIRFHTEIEGRPDAKELQAYVQEIEDIDAQKKEIQKELRWHKDEPHSSAAQQLRDRAAELENQRVSLERKISAKTGKKYEHTKPARYKEEVPLPTEEISDEDWLAYAGMDTKPEPQAPSQPSAIKSTHPVYKVFGQEVEKIVGGKKKVLSNTQPIQEGWYQLQDGTEIRIEGGKAALSFKQLEAAGKAEAWAQKEGYQSLEDAAENGTSRIKAFIKGKRSLYMANIAEIDRTKVELGEKQRKGLERHAAEAGMEASKRDRARGREAGEQELKWEYFDSEGMDPASMKFLDEQGKPIPFEDMGASISRQMEGGERGKIYVKPVLKDGTVLPERLISEFDMRQHLKAKSRAIPKQREIRSHEKAQAIDEMLLEAKIEETVPRDMDEETHEYLLNERKKEIEQEGYIDGEPLGEKSIDAAKKKLALKKRKEGETQLLEGEDVYHEGDIPAQPREFIGEEREFDAESLDFFMKMRRFKSVKKLVDPLAANSKALKKRVDAVVAIMDNNPDLKGGYSIYIGEMIQHLAQTHDFKTIIDFIKQEENILSIAELQGIPESLEDLTEFVNSGMKPYETEEEINNALTADELDMFIARVWTAVQRAVVDSEMLDDNRKAVARFVQEPRGAIKFVRDFFDYGATTVPDRISVKEMTELARAYRKEFGAEIDIEVMAVLVQATKDQRLIDYLKDPEQKMRQFKGDHDVSGLYPYTPETPKVRKVQREENKKTRKKLNKSAYQAFKDMTKTITTAKIDQTVVAGFYRALHKLASEGHSTKARLFDPVRIVGYMSNDPEVRKAFSVRKETKTATGKIIKQEVPFEERLTIVKELWQKSRIEYGTWTKRFVKEEAIGGLTAENIEVIKSKGAMHVQDIDKEIKLRDESFEYKSMAETKNVTGYRTRTATVVESVTYKSLGTGASVTINEPTPKQMEMVKERDPDYKVKTVEMPYMKPKEIKDLGKTRVVTASEESQATGDAKVYQVKLNDGDPIDMSWPEIVRGRRKGDEIEILGDAATYAVRVKNTKTGQWVGKKVRYDQLQFLKKKILEAHAKKTKVKIEDMTQDEVAKALDPYMRHVEYRGQQQIFPWDQSTLLYPLYDKAISQGVISMEDVGRQITNISYLKQVNREITEAKAREESFDELAVLKNDISNKIAAFNVGVKSKLVVNDFVASMVVDPEYFERMAEAYEIKGKTAEDLFEIFVRNGYNIDTTTMQVERMKRDQDMKEAHDLFLSKAKTPEAREKQIRSYVKDRLPKSPTLQKLFDKVLDNRASIIEVDDTFRSRQLFVAVQVYDLIDNAIGDRLVNRLGEDATANEIIKENWERLEQSFSTAANLRHSAGQNVPEDMIFTDTDTNMREKRKLDAFEQELVDKNPTMTIGRLMSKKASAFYRAVAKAFGADLVIVSDTFYQSRYIAKASDGKAKIIINIQSPTQFSRIFGHELFHHVVAKAAPNEYKAFRKAVIDVVTELNEDGTSENYGAWVGVVERMMRQRGIEYKENQDSVPFADLIEYLSEKGVSEEEIMAEIFASMVHDKGFYDALAKTFAGKGLAARMIVHLIEKVEQVAEIALRTYEGQPLYENGLLLNQDQLKQMHELFADFVGSAMLSTAPITAEYTRMHTSFGRKTVSDLNERLANQKSWFQGTWKKIFPEGTKNRKEVMSQLETHMQASVDWMKKMKPKVMWADWMADRMSLKYMNLIAHGQSKQVAKVRYSIISKHKKAFKNMTTEEKRVFHDLFVKGLHTRYVYKDAEGEKQTVLSKADVPYGYKYSTVVTDVGFADVNTPEGRERYKKFGYSDEIVDAMVAFKKVADEVYEELKKIYPDLDRHEFHYGQSIKWYRKDGVELDYKYDWDSSPDHSYLEGRKQFLKGKNMEKTTEQIEADGFEYLHLDPDRMLLDYVHDTYKLIYFKKALGQAMNDGHAKIFYIANQAMAAEKGYFPVNDGALRIIQNMAMPHGTKIITMVL
jgi:hypothetical protein